MSEDTRETHGTGHLPPSGERNIGDLVQRAKEDLRAWLEAEKEFFQSQISARVEMAAQPVMAFGMAAVLAFLGAGALTIAAGYALGTLIGDALGFALVGVAYAAVAFVLYLRGRHRMYRMLRMQVSLREAKPDADWAPPPKENPEEGAR